MMMWNAFLALLALLWTSAIRPDDGDPPAGGEGDPPAGGEGDPPDTPHRTLTFKTKEEEEAHYNKVYKDRDRRTREKIREEERTNVEAELKRQAAKDAENYKELLEEEEKKTANQQTRIETLEATEAERDTLQERVEGLEERLKGVIKPQLEKVPEIFRGLVEGMATVEEQAKWLEDNADKLEDFTTTTAQGPRGSRATGPAAGPKKEEPDEKKVEGQRRQTVSAF